MEGTLTREIMLRIVREMGFEESVLTIPEALENQTWPLLTRDFTRAALIFIGFPPEKL